jgi:hypothetical protein
MKRMVVTGSSGFVGGHVVRALASRGDEVVALDVAAPREPFASDKVQVVTADLRDAAALEQAVRGADSVFHVASRVQTRAHGSDEVFEVNVGGTESCSPPTSSRPWRRSFHENNEGFPSGRTHALPKNSGRLRPVRGGPNSSSINGSRGLRGVSLAWLGARPAVAHARK